MHHHSVPTTQHVVAGLADFYHHYAVVDGIRLHYVAGGNPAGETLVLLAGFPQSWFAWRDVMARLAARYFIIAPDLPGQGDSDCPLQGYDTEALGDTLHGLLSQLTVSRYFLAAHDVGSWVAFPYALRFGEELQGLALLDAGIPGVTLPDQLPVTPDRTWKTWHFAFHTLADLPEMLLQGRERQYLEWFLQRKTARADIFTPAVIDEYLRTLVRPGGLRAGLAYYRAASLSASQNRQWIAQGKLTVPLLAVSADQGSIADMAAPLRQYATQVEGIKLSHCGHYIPEEQPEALSAALDGFFAGICSSNGLH